MESKVCLDGSYVGRTGSNCEFAKCPIEDVVLSGFSNDQIEKAVVDYILTQEYFSWKTIDDSFNFCVIDNLDFENEIFPLYLWVYCGGYILENDELKNLSGFSGPVKINYPNELSFYDFRRFSYEAPRDGSLYIEDIKDMFPENIQQKILNYDASIIIKKTENIAHSNILLWEKIKKAIYNCEIEQVFQAHNRDILVKFKNGIELKAIEPKLDEIIKIALDAASKCGKIIMSTE